MRTNIDIDDALMERALKMSGLPTKESVVEEALKLLIRLRSQVSILGLFGINSIDLDVDASRRD